MTTPVRDLRPFWKRYFWPLILVIILIGGYMVAQVEITIRVTEAQAQELLDEQRKKLETMHPGVRIEAIDLKFQENTMSVEVIGATDVTVGKYPSQTFYANLYSRGDPDYRRGSIYFNADDFQLREFTINGKQPSEVARELIAIAAGKIVPDARDNILENKRVKGALEKLGVSVERAENDTALAGTSLAAEALVKQYQREGQVLLETAVLLVLETTPLYTLGRSWKERVAMAALQDIGIKEGVFTATLTGVQLLWTVFFLFLSVLIAVGMLLSLLRGGWVGIAAVTIGSLGE